MSTCSSSVEDLDNTDNNVEMQNLLGSYNDLEQGNCASGQTAPLKAGPKKPEGPFQRFLCQLDQRKNMKALMRVWGPRLEFVVRLMLISTFLEDSLSTATHFSEHTKQVSEQGYLLWRLAATYPGFVRFVATVTLGIGLLAKSVGSLCLLMLIQPDNATKALIGWTIAQPLLYAQLSNLEFVAESLSLVGGLLMLRAHLVPEDQDGKGSRVQLLGRFLLPTMYLFYAGKFMSSAFTLDQTNSIANFVASLSMFIIYIALLIGLMIGSMLVATGLRSRVVALLLALVNLGFVFYNHPFFRMIRFQGGEWKYAEDNMSIPNAVLTSDVMPNEVDPQMIYMLHRYYFFMGLSTSGALLLLAQFGPGEIAVQKDEIILPTRAQD